MSDERVKPVAIGLTQPPKRRQYTINYVHHPEGFREYFANNHTRPNPFKKPYRTRTTKVTDKQAPRALTTHLLQLELYEIARIFTLREANWMTDALDAVRKDAEDAAEESIRNTLQAAQEETDERRRSDDQRYYELLMGEAA